MSGKIFRTAKKDNLPEINRGGDAGRVFIAAKKLTGDGKILANGGDGSIGGKGGDITVISEDNQMSGELSASGGHSSLPAKRWWDKTWFQILMLLGVVASIVGVYFFIK